MKEKHKVVYYLEANVSPGGFSYKADKPTKGEILGLFGSIVGGIATIVIGGLITNKLTKK